MYKNTDENDSYEIITDLQISKVTGFLLQKQLCTHGLTCPCPEAIHMFKMEQ